MKHTKIIFALMVIACTFLSMWMLPSLVKRSTDEAKNYPFVYYSSVLKEICLFDFVNNQKTFQDIKGNTYPQTKYDSLLPLLNFRQLMMDGNLPDSLDGHELDPKVVRMKQVIFRFNPAKVNAPQKQLGVLMEAMPKRVGMTLPGDYFRMDNKITFIDAETNEVNEAKSERFTQEMIRKGFSFPVKHFWGNPTTRKAYEEGYFCLDNNNELFHVKMVNGRPFVKNTGMGQVMDIRWFAMHEVADKRYYGYLFGKKGEMGVIESTEEGGYRYLPMDIPAVDILKDDITVMGNMLYWTVRVMNDDGMDVHALKSNTLESVSHYHVAKIETLWDKLADWIFVTRFTPTIDESSYVSFYFAPIAVKAFLLNALLALIIFFRKKKTLPLKWRGFVAGYILLTGVIGMLALLFLPPLEK